MKMKDIIEKSIIELLKKSVTELPEDVCNTLKYSYDNEVTSGAKEQLDATIKNSVLAKEKSLPICQDTGIPIFYVEIGEEVKWIKASEIKNSIINATIKATSDIPLRPNAVNPFTDKNSDNNTGRYIPFINWDITEGEIVKITLLPKGGGSENMSALAMLKPTEGINGVKKFVIDTVIKAKGQPCPPIIVSVGIGGGADIALKIAKKSLLRNIGERHSEKHVANLEIELLTAINMLGIGPQGLGGNTTCLDVFIDYAHRHPASLPVGVIIQCWAARKASIIINKKGKVTYF